MSESKSQDAPENLPAKTTQDAAAPSESEVKPQPALDPDGVEEMLEMLEAISKDHSLLAPLDPETRQRLQIAAGRVSRPGREQRRALRRAQQARARSAIRKRDEALLHNTGLREGVRAPVFETPKVERPTRRNVRLPHRPAPIAPTAFGPTGDVPEPKLPVPNESSGRPAASARLIEPRNCYVCKRDYFDLHSFYDSMCPSCADFNWLKRIQTADLRGRTALVTGGRIKIGYHCVIKLLRAGAHVIVTTRSRATGRVALPRKKTSKTGRIDSRSTVSIFATPRASRPSRATCSKPTTDSTSSSTTRARPCVARPTSTRT